MTRALLLQLLLSCFAVAMVAAAAVLPRWQRDSRIEERLRLIGAPVPAAPPSSDLLPALMRRVGGFVLGSGILRGDSLLEVQRTVTAAGFRGSAALTVFVGAKASLFAGMPLLATVLFPAESGGTAAMIAAAAAVAGLLAPDLALRNMRSRHRSAVEKGLPDALDLLVICAEAGLPLEGAVERVAAEMAESSPAVAAEFNVTASELRILSDRRTALVNMGERTGLEPLKRLGGTLAQTLQYGTPLTQALRVLGAELRGEMLTRFEARAARLPALLTLPTILFILPCIFLVVGGPAVLRVMDMMRGP